MGTSSRLTVSTPSAREGKIFPPEVLSLIFKNAFTPTLFGSLDDGLPTKLTAIRVCRYWRQVACEDPELWKSVSLLFRTPGDLLRGAWILGFHLENSKSRPLDITLKFTPNQTYSSPIIQALVHPSVDGDIISHADRVECLSLKSLPHSKIATWLDHIQEFSGLHTLEIDRAPGLHVDLSRNPTIHSLHLSWMFGPISIQGSNIRVLTLHSIPIDTCTKLLFECRNLEKCTMTTPTTRYLSVMPSPEEVVAFPNLVDFAWEFIRNGLGNGQEVLEYLDAPFLQNLVWRQKGRWGMSQRSEATFCQRLPTGLKHIEIETVYENEADAGEEDNLLSVIPGRLQIDSLSLVYDSFQALLDSASYLVPSEDSPHLMPFPNLTEIYLTSEDYLNCDRLVAFLKVIRRRIRPDFHLTIMFSAVEITCTRADLPDDDEAVDVLESGNLTIITDGEPF